MQSRMIIATMSEIPKAFRCLAGFVGENRIAIEKKFSITT
jgi:hypothetical protein